MSEDISYNIGYVTGQVVFVTAIIGGLTWLIVWSVGNSRKMADRKAQADAALPVRLGLAPGEAVGPVWTALHPSGAPMMVTITSAGVLVLNYVAGDAPAIRIAHNGVKATAGRAFPPPAGSKDPRIEIEISSPEYAAFTVLVEQAVATQILTWATPA
jgi:hypothetical protein